MAIVPRQLVEKVQFFETHLVAFGEHAAAIGLTAAEVAELQAKADAARDAHRVQQVAQQEARAATLGFNIAVDALGTVGVALLQKIRAHAESTQDPNVLHLARVPAAAKRSPTAEPGTPFELTTRLGGNGSLILQWKCKNPRGSTGTVYQLSRRIGPDGPFAYLGLTGEKRFVDNTIPAGATAIEYEIRAVRSTKAGEVAIFPVRFGTNGQSLPAASTVPTRVTMLAA
jgi:hypothetical protein